MIWIVVAVVVSLLLAGTTTMTGAPSTGSASTRAKPPSVPRDVWRYASTVQNMSRSMGYPFDPSYALATIWQESGGRLRARGSDGERGLMQMTQIALDDVHQNYPNLTMDIPRQVYELEDAPARTQIKAGMLFQRLQAKRCRRMGSGQLVCMLKSYNEGFPPHGFSGSYADEVRQKQEQIGRLG